MSSTRRGLRTGSVLGPLDQEAGHVAGRHRVRGGQPRCAPPARPVMGETTRRRLGDVDHGRSPIDRRIDFFHTRWLDPAGTYDTGGNDAVNYWTRKQFTRRRLLSTTLWGGTGLVTAAAVGCGSDESSETSSPAPGESPAGSPSAATQQPDTNATLRAAIISDIANLDPQTQVGNGYFANSNNHFISLLNVDQKTREPVAYAVDWKWIENNTTIQMTVKPNIKFHNGEVLDAEAVKFSLDRGRGVVTPELVVAGKNLWGPSVKDVTVVDARTVNVILSAPLVTTP